MLWATTLACRSPCCAVGGWNPPVLGSGTAAQSPNAQTPGQPSNSRDSVTSRRPRFFAQGIVSSNGFGEVPAVQINVLVGIVVPSLNRTLLPEYDSTRVFNRISTLRASSFRRA